MKHHSFECTCVLLGMGDWIPYESVEEGSAGLELPINLIKAALTGTVSGMEVRWSESSHPPEDVDAESSEDSSDESASSEDDEEEESGEESGGDEEDGSVSVRSGQGSESGASTHSLRGISESKDPDVIRQSESIRPSRALEVRYVDSLTKQTDEWRELRNVDQVIQNSCH